MAPFSASLLAMREPFLHSCRQRSTHDGKPEQIGLAHLGKQQQRVTAPAEPDHVLARERDHLEPLLEPRLGDLGHEQVDPPLVKGLGKRARVVQLDRDSQAAVAFDQAAHRGSENAVRDERARATASSACSIPLRNRPPF